MGNCCRSHPTDPNNSPATENSDGRSQFFEGVNGEFLPEPHLKKYSFSDLKKASNNFNSGMVIGVGGFGTTFKGWVNEKTLAPSSNIGSGITIAIKKHNDDSLQGFNEWQSEVKFLGRLFHPNLIKLLGYCREESKLLLVYEFMQNGSLENHLFRRSNDVEPLSWNIRLKVSIGAARALTFLHSSENQVIYRDFNSSNILLDENYNVKLTNFGFAKLGPSSENTHVSTRVLGTYGYAAPEYVATGHLYMKSDVYGFGVVLLELLTGLRAIDTNRPSEQHNLFEWAKPKLSHKMKLKSIIDLKIQGQYSSEVVWRVAKLTLVCLDYDPRKRPCMKEVLDELERIEAIEEKRKNEKQ